MARLAFLASVALVVLGSVARAGDLDQLAAKLRDSDARARREAVAGLAELGTPEAWTLVLGALSDADAQPADEAQLALGATTDPKLVERLLGKEGLGSKEERVRERACEALGRVGVAFDGEPLARELRSKDAVQRRRVCWTIERQALAGRPPNDAKGTLRDALEKSASRERDPEVRAAAQLALGALAPDLGEVLLKGTSTAEDLPAQIASIDLAVRTAGDDKPSLVGFLSGKASRPERAVRSAAQAALADLAASGDRGAVSALVGRLELEANERLGWELVSTLRRVSGLAHGRDVRPWRDWSAALDESWRPASGDGRSNGVGAGETRAAFVGLPLLSTRLAFLIDFSGSTWAERSGGKTRKQRLDAELRSTLERLDEGSHFDLVPYTDRPWPWKGSLVPADERTVEKALAWFEKQNQHGVGDFLGAALATLSLDEADTMVVLTDGAPTGGEHWNLRLIVPWLLERNRFRRVAYDVVLVDASRGLRRFWEELAEGSGGRVLDVQLGE